MAAGTLHEGFLCALLTAQEDLEGEVEEAIEQLHWVSRCAPVHDRDACHATRKF